MDNHKTSLNKQEEIQLPQITNSVSAESYLRENGTLLIPFINHKFKTISGLDLSRLPEEYRIALIKWLIEVNRRRLMAGHHLLITYDIIKQCPIWKAIKMPFRQWKLDPEKLTKDLKKIND